MSGKRWWANLVRRLGWSLGVASLWTWGLLALRMLRDGFQPLDVWFGYSLSFFMTAVYVYLGLLIYSTVRAEARLATDVEQTSAGAGELSRPPSPRWTQRAYRPVSAIGLIGLLAGLVSMVGWLAFRYPGPQAVSGTYGSMILALMVLGVAAAGTVLARD